MRAFKAQKRSGPQGGVTFDFSRQSVAVNHYYFYVQDAEWDRPSEVWDLRPITDQAVSQRPCEWVKQQLRRARVLRQSRQWISRLCGPDAAASDLRSTRARRRAELLRPLDGAAAVADDRGRSRRRDSHRLALHQVEVSLTQVFERPSKAGTFLKPSSATISTWADPIASASCSPSHHASDTDPHLRLSHPRDHRWRRAEPPDRVPVLAREAVNSKSSGPYGPRPRSITRTIFTSRRACRTWRISGISAIRSTANSSRSNASAISAS